ncbi:MAG: SRPBCC family protein [Pirellulales bacterium]|nr:SRPBCC family protein [Pirellulales bacterium]
MSGSATFDTDLEDMWDAVTNPERIPRWFLPISGDLRPGGRYQLEGNAGGKISRCDPPEALDVTWECSGNISWVRVRLDAHDDGTRLTLEHIMLKDEASEEHWRKYGPGATGVGWDLSFFGLLLHIRTGESILQDEYHAWLATENGKTFIRECSMTWGSAHIASGEDDPTAKGMAEQTAKFYCGE